MAEVGILITAEDQASKTFKAMGGAAKKSLGAVRGLASKAKAAFDMLGAGLGMINNMIGIGAAAWGQFQAVMDATVGVALQFRKEGDKVSTFFKNLKRDTDLLKAAVGDALIPVIMGLAEGFNLVGRGAANWVRENRKLIATKVLEFVMNVGRVLTKSVAQAALLVTKVWYGWREVIQLVEVAALKGFGAIMVAVQKTLDTFIPFARMFGADGLAGKLESASKSAADMGESFSDAGEESLAALSKTMDEHEKLENRINNIADVALVSLEKAGVKAQQAIAESTAGTTRTLDEQKERLTNMAAFIDQLREQRLAKIEEANARELQMAQEKDRLMMEQQMALSQNAAAGMDVISGLMDTLATEQANATALMAEAQEAAATGAADASEKMSAAMEAQGAVHKKVAKQAGLAIIDSVIAQVQALAIQGAAGAFAALASIPVVGPALGAAAAIAVQASILALGAGLKGLIGGMADGGVVTGGNAGSDSVPAMLMPGEQVMSVPERRAMQKFMGRLLGAQAGRTTGGLSGSETSPAGQPLVVNNQTVLRTWTPNLQEETQMARRLEEESRQRLARQGMLMGGQVVTA